MNTTVNLDMFVERFEAFDRATQFSANGLRALFNHLCELECELGEEMELDVIAICCDFTEFAGIVEAANAFHDFGNFVENDFDDDQLKAAAHRFLSDNTQVVVFEGGVIIQNF